MTTLLSSSLAEVVAAGSVRLVAARGNMSGPGRIFGLHGRSGTVIGVHGGKQNAHNSNKPHRGGLSD